MVVLANGAVPLHVLEEEVRDWVDNHHKGQEVEGEECECHVAAKGKSRCSRSTKVRKDEKFPTKIQYEPRYETGNSGSSASASFGSSIYVTILTHLFAFVFFIHCGFV